MPRSRNERSALHAGPELADGGPAEWPTLPQRRMCCASAAARAVPEDRRVRPVRPTRDRRLDRRRTTTISRFTEEHMMPALGGSKQHCAALTDAEHQPCIPRRSSRSSRSSSVSGGVYTIVLFGRNKARKKRPTDTRNLGMGSTVPVDRIVDRQADELRLRRDRHTRVRWAQKRPIQGRDEGRGGSVIHRL